MDWKASLKNMERILDNIRNPEDLRKLELEQLPALAQEIRQEIINTVSKTGGHLASSLGAVELTLALHYTFNTPTDCLLWDVGHQVYTHKILTGRLERFSTLRQLGGLSGFPNKDESPYDLVTCGHASTSVSTALGLAIARDLKKEAHKIAVIIGDAALAGGMAFEALNQAGHLKKDLIIILNDNELSISPTIGALSRYLNRILTNPAYNRIRRDVEGVLKRIPRFGFRAYRAARRLEEGLKNLLVPGMLFEELGFRYFGPIDGHNIAQLVRTFQNLKSLNEPILIHVVTKKGKGYRFAEERPGDFHGTGPFNIETGEKAVTVKDGRKTFTEAFGEKMVELANRDERIIGITAAMIDGTGMGRFASDFPDRFFDVGISEEHAVTFAAGVCLKGFRPFVAVYSTFLQRGYDQIIHDVCLQNLPVVFCIDRAGVVGEDGPTHQGLFDIAYLRHIPNLVVMAPQDPDELASMLEFALRYKGPVAIRYPKGSAISHKSQATSQSIQLGKAEVVKEGGDLAILALGSMVDIAIETEGILSQKYGLNCQIVNARFARPLDDQLIGRAASVIKKIVTLEEGVLDGGFGSAVLEFIEQGNFKDVRVKRIGFPSLFLEHGRRNEIFAKYNMTPEAISNCVMNDLMDKKPVTSNQ